MKTYGKFSRGNWLFTIGCSKFLYGFKAALTGRACRRTRARPAADASDAENRILLQLTRDEKTSKERMHLDIETDDVDAEVAHLKVLGATTYDHQQERGYDFWVMRDPWDNEFCVLQPEFLALLARRRPWPD